MSPVPTRRRRRGRASRPDVSFLTAHRSSSCASKPKHLLLATHGGDASAHARLAAIAQCALGGPAHAHQCTAHHRARVRVPKLAGAHAARRGNQRQRSCSPPHPAGGALARSLLRLPTAPTRRPTTVFAMFVAARDGDIEPVRQLVAVYPALATVEYNYTPPIHFAVREGHRDIVEFLLDHGADPAYRSYPFQESLLTFAEDRGHADVAELLRRQLSRRFALMSGTPAIIAAAARATSRRVQAELAATPRSLAPATTPAIPRSITPHATGIWMSFGRCSLRARRGRRARRRLPAVHCALMPNWFFQVEPGPRRRSSICCCRAARGTRSSSRPCAATISCAGRARPGPLPRQFRGHLPPPRALGGGARSDVAMTRLLLEHGADPNLPEEGAPRGLSLWIGVTDRQRGDRRDAARARRRPERAGGVERHADVAGAAGSGS